MTSSAVGTKHVETGALACPAAAMFAAAFL